MPKNTHQGPSIAGWNVPLPGETREDHAERLGVPLSDLEYTGAGADADMRRQQAGDRPDTSAPDLGVSGHRESIHSGGEGPNVEPAAPAGAPDETAGEATTAGDREKTGDLRKGPDRSTSTEDAVPAGEPVTIERADKGRHESK